MAGAKLLGRRRVLASAGGLLLFPVLIVAPVAMHGFLSRSSTRGTVAFLSLEPRTTAQ